MTRQILLKLTDSGAVLYSLAQFRADHTSVSMRDDPTPEHLEPYGVVFGVIADPPAVDTVDQRLQRLEQLPPELINDEWVINWATRPATEAEIHGWDEAHRPEPDWSLFKTMLRKTPAGQMAAGTILGILKAQRPLDAEVFATAFLAATEGNPKDFITIWQDAKNDGLIPAQVLTTFATMADKTNLPDNILELFR